MLKYVKQGQNKHLQILKRYVLTFRVVEFFQFSKDDALDARLGRFLLHLQRLRQKWIRRGQMRRQSLAIHVFARQVGL